MKLSIYISVEGGKYMDDMESKFEQNDESALPSSLKLALIAAILVTLADGLAAIAAISAIEEAINEIEKEQQQQKELNEKIEKMQKEIDKLKMALRYK